MKKALLLFFFISGCVTVLKAQKKFELHINNVFVYVNGKPVSTIDSIKLGDTVTLNISFQNEGAFPVINSQYQQDSFPGGTYNFDYNVSDSGAFTGKIDFHHQMTLPGLPYKASATANDTFTATAAFFKPGKNNIVIIWPGGAKAVAGNDSIDTTIQKGTMTFYVFPELKTAGISNIPQNNSFKIYPNPAKDMVNIQMNETGTGMIRLMDMTGKLITSMPYSAKAGENIILPLNGLAIPDGLYLIGIESGNGSQVSKIMICR